MPFDVMTMSSANSVPRMTSLSKPVPPSTETGALTLYWTSSSPPPARMSSGRAVEKPRPMIGRATPSASSGMTSSSHSVWRSSSRVVWRRRCCRRRRALPLTELSSRRPVGPRSRTCRRRRRCRSPSLFVSTGKSAVTGSAARSMSAKSQSPSPSASVSQTAAQRERAHDEEVVVVVALQAQLGLVGVDDELVVAGAAGRDERRVRARAQPAARRRDERRERVVRSSRRAPRRRQVGESSSRLRPKIWPIWKVS